MTDQSQCHLPGSPSLIADLVSVLREALRFVEHQALLSDSMRDRERASTLVGKINIALVRAELGIDSSSPQQLQSVED